MAENVLPSSLDFTVQGGGHCAVRWENGKVLFYPDGWWVQETPAVEIKPSDAQWEIFWYELDGAGVWNWHGDYGAGVMCGTSWKLFIERGTRTVNCSGNNWRVSAAPATFREFLSALIKLLGLPDTKLSLWIAD